MGYFYFARHGQTVWNVENKICGATDIELTEKGRRVARQVLRRHTLLRSFLMKLGVSRPIADRDACLMEHILSAETLDRIRTYMKDSK